MVDPHAAGPPDELQVRVLDPGAAAQFQGLKGATFTGWKEVQVIRPLEAIAGAFRLSLPANRAVPIRRGSRVSIEVGTEPILTGYVESMLLELGENSAELTVAGRDLAGDLVDCQEPSAVTEWHSVTLDEIALELAQPFGVTEVRLDGLPTAPFDVFQAQPGESSWATLERALRMRARLAYSAGDGAVVLAGPPISRAARRLVYGENLLELQIRTTDAERFRFYTVRGQARGSDQGWGTVSAHVEGRAEDLGVARNRPLVILAESQVTPSDAEDRAAWEASMRRARSGVVRAVVRGWRQVEGGDPWRVNELVEVRADLVGFAQELLIRRVEFVRSLDAGNVVTLELVRPDSYIPKPVLEEDPTGDPFESYLGDEEDQP